MEAEVLNALRAKLAYLSGSHDRNEHILIIVPVPYEIKPWTKAYIDTTIKYILASLSSESLNKGFVIIIDTKKYPCRIAKSIIKQLSILLDTNTSRFIIVRPDPFFDTHRMENCGRNNKKRELITIPKSRLPKYFELSALAEEFGGHLKYDHDEWIKNRMSIDKFHVFYEQVMNDAENLQIMLIDKKTMRLSESNEIMNLCTAQYDEVQKKINDVIVNGNLLLTKISETLNGRNCQSQDLKDSNDAIKVNLNDIEKRSLGLSNQFTALKKNLINMVEIATLEKGVSYVTNWILDIGEMLLNGQQKIGSDVSSCDSLRKEHEALEMKCLETYGFYAELLHKIDVLPFFLDNSVHSDLISQKDFMDFVCRSFATRLERRRNVLITSLRFYRLVSIYFDRTNEVFENLVISGKVDDFNVAITNLQKLKNSQQTLGNVEKDLKKEGEKLSDMLSMPVKDALGRDIGVDYSGDIGTIREILEATMARRKIFVNSVELQKLTLEQVANIQTCENDATIAIKWVEDLYNVMIKTNSHVGCSINEIQMQKEELQTFKETAKSTYNYGCQLLDAALLLRQSCKLNDNTSQESHKYLKTIYLKLEATSQEQMTRLRVSAVFHRSIEEHCSKLKDLKVAVTLLDAIDDLEHRRNKLRKYLASREKLLLEVGRMVRLGRLLKSRLKEPFSVDCDNNGSTDAVTILPTCGNIIACDAITTKLTEVAEIAEALDFTLKNVQTTYDVDQSVFCLENEQADKLERNANSSSDELNVSVKSSTEDESFITASECTPTTQSRSSYQTASEGCISPWWSLDKTPNDSETESRTNQRGILSSANTSFDEAEDNLIVSHNISSDVQMVHKEESQTLNRKKLTLSKESSQRSTQKLSSAISWDSYGKDKIVKSTIKRFL